MISPKALALPLTPAQVGMGIAAEDLGLSSSTGAFAATPNPNPHPHPSPNQASRLQVDPHAVGAHVLRREAWLG